MMVGYIEFRNNFLSFLRVWGQNPEISVFLLTPHHFYRKYVKVK
jgi:hypothetical protein